MLPSLIAPAFAGTITDRLGLAVGVLAAAAADPGGRVHHRSTDAGLCPDRTAVRSDTRGSAQPSSLRPGSAPSSRRCSSRIRFAAVGGAAAGLAIGLPSLRRLLPPGVHRAVRGLPAVVLCRILATAAFLGADSFIPLAADRIHGASPTIQGFVIIGASLSWTGGQWFMSRHPGIDPRRAVRWGFSIVALGLVASIPVLSESWPLWATFFGWAFGGFGMGLLFNPTTVTAMSWAQEGVEGLVSSQVNLADAIGFSMMGGIGGAMVAVSERTGLSLPGALGINFTLAIALACLGTVCARRIAAR